MANTITTQTLFDGSNHLVVNVYLESDGSSGELTAQKIVDPASYTPVPTLLTLEKIWYQTNGCNAKLLWDASTDVPFFVLSDTFSEEACWQEFGGIKNNAGSGVTGQVLITTLGFLAAGDRISMQMVFKKVFSGIVV